MFADYARAWPVHALLMISAVASLLVAVWTITFGRQRKGSFRLHKDAAVAALILLTAGLIVATVMVQAGGGPHLRAVHGVIGAASIALGLLAMAAGLAATKAHAARRRLRMIHVWAGRAVVLLFLITILAGLRKVGLL